MKISICIPVYGVEKYIERCARSVFEQSYENIEYIFVNDCTKDHSIEILNAVLMDYPSRKNQVRIINHKCNKGLAGARNTAVENTTGEFIFWLDSDDFIKTSTISKVVEEQVKSDADIVITDFLKLCDGYNEYVSQKNTNDPHTFIHKMLRDECEHWLCGKLIRTSLYKENDIKALEGANMGEDFQVCPQLMYFAKKISYVTEPLYVYDMQNLSSYGHSVKESVQWQRWKSYNVVKEKLPQSDFKEDLEYQQMQMCYFQLKAFYKSSQSLSIEYYNYLISKIREIDSKTLNDYVFYKRLLLQICLKVGEVKNVGDLPLNKVSRYIDLLNTVRTFKKKIFYFLAK